MKTSRRSFLKISGCLTIGFSISGFNDAFSSGVLQELPEGFNGSVLDLLLERRDDLRISRAAISATNATAEVAKALEIQRGDVLLQFVSQLYTASGKIVDYSISYFIPGYFHFYVNRRVGNS